MPESSPWGGSEKYFALNAHFLLESLCWTWAKLYGNVATLLKEMLRDKIQIKQEVKKPKDNNDNRIKKLTGKFEVCIQKLRAVQDVIIERGTAIFDL